MGQNAETWIKYFEARQLLKNNDYVALSQLFNKPIGDSDIVQGFKYVTDGVFNVDDLNKAIEIANRIDDVQIISNKLGIPFDLLKQAKKHYYIDEHLIFINGEFRIGRFERDFIDNTEWERMINKNINELTNDEITNFKRLVVHEYIESKLMEKGMNFRSFIDPFNYHAYDFGAHDIAPKINDSKYLDLGRYFSPSSPDLNNFENINNILNWYINFYKL